MDRAVKGGRRTYRAKMSGRAVLGEREKRRLLQLLASLVLFFTVFAAKGTGRLEDLRGKLKDAIAANVDLQGAMTDLGWAVASGQGVGETLGELWEDVFLPQPKAPAVSWQGGPLYMTAIEEGERLGCVSTLMQAGPTAEKEKGSDPIAQSIAQTWRQDTAEPAAVPEPTAEPEVIYMNYTGPELPEHTSMDRYALGLSETVSPVLAPMTSDFGWREHPIEGGQKFHYGVDLGVPTGTEVKAFAAGKVEFIGEGDSYGLYLQLDHGNGVKSLYAHCSRLCVKKGQTVAVGEKVAESGATGEVTGPHLHFELKKDGVRLEPLYYIETTS